MILNNKAEFANSNKLFHDYINNSKNLEEFYTWNYRDNISWQNVAHKIKEKNFDYRQISSILRRQNEHLGAGDQVLSKIDKLVQGNALAIVTGQQAGIFTGPLYTIYKALTAIKLADHLSGEYDFIPIFWVESNDHDLQEVNHIYLLDSDNNLEKLEYTPSQYTIGSSVKDVFIDEGFSDVIDRLEAYLPNTEFKDGIFRIIRESYLPSDSISSGFSRMMSRLFSKYGLVFLDPSDPDIKQLMSPILKKEIESPLESTRLINGRGEMLRSLGYESQIAKSDDSTCLFYEENGARCKVLFRDEYFELDGGQTKLSVSELLEALEDAPYRFSPNVALRPVVQDFMLPTAAYVAGPGETAYFAQLADLYEYMGVNMPIIYPRASLAIIENKVQHVMERNALDISDLSEHYDELFSRLSRERASDRIEKLIESARSDVDNIFNELSSELAKFDPGMKNVTESAGKKIDYQLNLLRERAYQAQRSRDDIMRNQIKRACMNVYPDRKPQERVFNIVQYLVLYGLQFLDEIMSAIELDIAFDVK